MVMTQRDKSKWRSQRQWKDFRKKLKDERKVDAVTLKPLRSGFNLHHLDMSNQKERYTDLSDETKFVACNKQTHEIIHHLYRYYAKDPSIVQRLEEILKKMKEINK